MISRTEMISEQKYRMSRCEREFKMRLKTILIGDVYLRQFFLLCLLVCLQTDHGCLVLIDLDCPCCHHMINCQSWTFTHETGINFNKQYRRRKRVGWGLCPPPSPPPTYFSGRFSQVAYIGLSVKALLSSGNHIPTIIFLCPSLTL